jgi:hypothetical protein
MFKRKKQIAPPVLIAILVLVAGGLLLSGWLIRRIVLRAKRGSVATNSASSAENRFAMPSSRLGATEDQMSKTMPPPAENPLRSGEVSVAGAAHEFDPNSITPG